MVATSYMRQKSPGNMATTVKELKLLINFTSQLVSQPCLASFLITLHSIAVSSHSLDYKISSDLYHLYFRTKSSFSA